MNRRDFLKTGGGSAALLLSASTWCAAAEKAAADDNDILAEARSLIEKHRKGNGIISVRDAKGQPVVGVRIKLEQLRHDFLFGCNFFGFDRCGDPEREQKYREQFAGLFNYCTLGFYWGAYEPERGQPNYQHTDRVLEWTKAHGIRCKGHPLVWDHPASSPSWLPDDDQAILRLSNQRVRDIVSKYRGRLDYWDVVNEATHLPERVNKTRMARVGAALGPVAYTSGPLKIAREANPGAKLLVNDYRTDPPYYRLLEALRTGDRFQFDVIGIQSHMHDGVWSPGKVREICDRFARLGSPLHFTETTIVSGLRQGQGWGPTTPDGEARQAGKTAAFYITLFAHPAVEAITWWDFSDHRAWQRAPAGWLRDDMSPKPVYERMNSLIKGEWWTKAEGITDENGEFKPRAFFGTHRLTITPQSGAPLTRDVHWERGGRNQFELRVA